MKKQQLHEALAVLLTKLSSARDNPLLMDNYVYHLSLPMFSIAWTVYLLLCEFKSIREKAYEKAEIRKQDRTMQVILENKDEIAKAVVEIMKEERKKGGDNEDN